MGFNVEDLRSRNFMISEGYNSIGGTFTLLVKL